MQPRIAAQVCIFEPWGQARKREVHAIRQAGRLHLPPQDLEHHRQRDAIVMDRHRRRHLLLEYRVRVLQSTDDNEVLNEQVALDAVQTVGFGAVGAPVQAELAHGDLQSTRTPRSSPSVPWIVSPLDSVQQLARLGSHLGVRVHHLAQDERDERLRLELGGRGLHDHVREHQEVPVGHRLLDRVTLVDKQLRHVQVGQEEELECFLRDVAPLRRPLGVMALRTGSIGAEHATNPRQDFSFWLFRVAVEHWTHEHGAHGQVGGVLEHLGRHDNLALDLLDASRVAGLDVGLGCRNLTPKL